MNGKKSNHTKRSARTVPQKLHIEKGARGLGRNSGDSMRNVDDRPNRATL